MSNLAYPPPNYLTLLINSWRTFLFQERWSFSLHLINHFHTTAQYRKNDKLLERRTRLALWQISLNRRNPFPWNKRESTKPLKKWPKNTKLRDRSLFIVNLFFGSFPAIVLRRFIYNNQDTKVTKSRTKIVDMIEILRIITCTASKRVPATFAMVSNVIHECKVFLDRPWPSSQVHHHIIFFFFMTAFNGVWNPSWLNIHYCFLFLQMDTLIDPNKKLLIDCFPYR